MKKLLTCTALLLMFTSTKAQFELKAGVSLYPNVRLTQNVYPLIGVGYNQSLSNKVSLRYEALFAHYAFTNGDTSNEVLFPFTMNFLIMPKLSLHAGLQYSVAFNRYQSDITNQISYQTYLHLVSGLQYKISNRLSFFGRYINVTNFDHFQIGITYHSRNGICKKIN
jgi:hypothetical protein